jgi:putative transposase
MPRRELRHVTGVIFHVLNRGARRLRLFDDPGDYDAFLRVVEEGRSRTGIELLAYCVMPNHFHLLVKPVLPGQLSEFMWWFQMTHAKRWHEFQASSGTGAVYQGRFRAVPIQDDGHFVVAARYIERNPLRAGLVDRAERWPWSSLHQRCNNSNVIALSEWPIPPPPNWVLAVNHDETVREVESVRDSITRGAPFGSPLWAQKTFGVRARRSRGRPPRDTQAVDLRFS